MQLIKRDSILWNYLTEELQDLIDTGEVVATFVHDHRGEAKIYDYSFIVFSFSKAYEGFLKKLFLDMGLIKEHEYYGDEIRIGRILSPDLLEEKQNVFLRVCNKSEYGVNLSRKLWDVWKRGRNLVFHYFPHNFRKLTYAEAFSIAEAIVDAMTTAVDQCIKEKPKS